jgi:hypothetical protein
VTTAGTGVLSGEKLDVSFDEGDVFFGPAPQLIRLPVPGFDYTKPVDFSNWPVRIAPSQNYSEPMPKRARTASSKIGAPLKAKHGSSPFAGLAAGELAIMDPIDAPPGVIFGDEFEVKKSVPAQPYVRFNGAFSAGLAGAGSQRMGMADTDMGGFLFRDPLRQAVIYTRNPSQGATPKKAVYNWVYERRNGQDVPGFPLSKQDTEKFLAPMEFIADASTEWKPHTDIYYPGRDQVDNPDREAVYGMWIDGVSTDGTASGPGTADINCILNWTVATGAGYGQFFNVYKWDGDQFSPYLQAVGVSAAGQVSLVVPDGSGNGALIEQNSGTAVKINSPGYYALKYIGTAPTAGGSGTSTASDANFPPNAQVTQVQVTMKSDSWAHIKVPGIEAVRDTMGQVKMIGSSIRLENQTQLLQVGGSVVAVQVTNDFDMYSDFIVNNQAAIPGLPYIAGNFFNNINAQDNAKEGPLAKGMYAFVQPTAPKDLAWTKIWEFDVQGVSDSIGFPINSKDGFIAFAISAPGTAAAPLNFNMIIHLAAYLNYQVHNTNEWVVQLLPNFSYGEQVASVQRISQTPNLYENPFHWRAIANFIGKAGSWLKRFLSTAAPAAVLINPAAGAGAMFGSNIAGIVGNAASAIGSRLVR